MSFIWDFGDEPSVEERPIDMAFTLEGRAVLEELARMEEPLLGLPVTTAETLATPVLW